MLTDSNSNYRRPLFLGIILIALGIVFNTTLASSAGSLGTVLIAVGGLFFIIGMTRKRKAEEG
ncbi:MAG: hypothetical protein EP344_08575 [Bacteroidetes bacterium]|nr:MAG: hypothetical protein EP344_08575 [Bacteroidota bacterium]